MNALRNIFTSRTLNYLRQNGQNAILNATQQQQAVDAVPLSNDGDQQLKAPRPAPLSIPRSILDACQFAVKPFDLGRNASGNGQSNGSLSPTTLKRFRRMQRRMELVYRCKLCNTRNTKTISEEAYYSGVVILQCDGCAVDHLIKDNLGLFTGSDGDSSISSGISTSKNIDQVLAERHARVRVIKVNEHGELI
ncbi:uncharacterized protein LOC128260521 [Drosophila gunungcola]|uniref:DNL-type domain-containing protein n=1 Tax=Drosophila gunungcola TaxID=103775 RepID=A0A9Q0BL88_9MUSC|nr:uncharacterized protein LOC128260521 [Drosophila gunungcola]KAI8035554.1 hypothetical protein M5D96_011603 [Drosophila gunungcola]